MRLASKRRLAVAPKRVANTESLPQPREEERNISVLREAYADWDACKGADASVWTRLVAPAFVMHSLAQGVDPLAFTARVCCPSDLDRYFVGLARDWSMNFFRIDRFVAQGAMVVAIGECSFTNRHTGKTVTTPKVDVFQFLHGKIVEVSEFYDTAQTIAAARP
jgi:ketosteroid isomerase-like protein